MKSKCDRSFMNIWTTVPLHVHLYIAFISSPRSETEKKPLGKQKNENQKKTFNLPSRTELAWSFRKIDFHFLLFRYGILLGIKTKEGKRMKITKHKSVFQFLVHHKKCSIPFISYKKVFHQVDSVKWKSFSSFFFIYAAASYTILRFTSLQ